MTQESRAQLAIKFWSEQAQALATEQLEMLAERQELLGRLAQAQLEVEVLRSENQTLLATQANQQESSLANELALELDLARHMNAELKERHEALTAEWEKQSQRLMQLSLENERLKGGDVPADAPRVEVSADLPPDTRKTKGLKGRPPIIRNCNNKACGKEFTVDYRNRLYCGEDCAFTRSQGKPRRKPADQLRRKGVA